MGSGGGSASCVAGDQRAALGFHAAYYPPGPGTDCLGAPYPAAAYSYGGGGGAGGCLDSYLKVRPSPYPTDYYFTRVAGLHHHHAAAAAAAAARSAAAAGHVVGGYDYAPA